MKKQMTGLIIYSLIMLLVLSCTAEAQGVKESGEKVDVKAVYLEIGGLFRQGKYKEVIKRIDQAMKQLGMTMRLMHMKYDVLMRMARFDDALRFVDYAIKKTGESEELLSARFNVLIAKREFPAALKSAMRKEKIAKKKSPWDCMNIAHIYLKMGSKEEAMDWIQEAVNRGFISYRLLAGKQYRLIKNEKRLFDMIKMIHTTIGLGSPARNFQVNLLDGTELKLFRQKGKVVLINFWATWCEACIRDIEQLKKTYKLFQNRQFEIIGISLDTDKKRLTNYLAKKKLDWVNSCSGKGWEDKTVKRYGINSLPSYWLIDKKGVLRSFGLKGQELRKVIASLLAEK